MSLPPPDHDAVLTAREPVCAPGVIQPHGWMLVLDGESGRLRALSDNAPPRARVEEALHGLLQRFQRMQVSEAPAALGTLSVEGSLLDVTAHRSNGSVIVEFEPATPDDMMQAAIYSLARSFLPQLQQADSLDRLASLAVQEVQRLTGFGRCLLYRFDPADQAEVIAEGAEEGYERYLGHHFPASHIPPEEPELYRLNHIRLVADASAVAVGLAAVDPAFEPRALDMRFAALRGVSPVHRETLRQMGARASLAVSLVVRGRLWGLIACHDAAPRHVPLQTRVACEHLGQLVSLQIEAKEDNAEVSTRLELRDLTLEIVSHLADSDSTLQRLVEEPVPLLRLARASGAAVVLNDECWTVGTVPPREQLLAVSQWVAQREADVVHTDRLLEDGAVPGLDAGPCAGLLAISISQIHRHQILWFRSELVQTLQWAGDPERPSGTEHHPQASRRGFARWQQQVRGRSQPWSFSEVAAALELRQALIGIVLRRAEELASVAAELGRLNKELEAFSYTVSHDLRAPMRHITGYVDLVLEMEGAQLGERCRRYLSNAKDAAAYAGQLVDALLDFSRLGRSALNKRVVDTGLMIDELVAEMRGQDGGGRVHWVVHKPLPPLWGDPFLLQVAVRNLLANAVKYSRGRERPQVHIAPVQRPEGLGLEIRDNGVGFQQKYVGKLFGVFQRLHATEEFEGTGIGLANVRRIVERHGGSVWANGVMDQGASFGFVIPAEPKEM